MPKSTIISCNTITKKFGTTEALRGISLEVNTGEVVAVMGPSGSGKSTLLHSLAAISSVDSGEVLFNGNRIDQLSDNKRSVLRRSSFGFVFQFSQLVPELTALDNVALPLLLNNTPKKDAYSRASSWLRKVGIEEKANSQSSELSGGQTQRVAIARAMVVEPKVIFADEPTGSLDSLNSEHVMELFVSTVKEHNTAVIMVTHEPTIAAYADREIVVRDGKLAGRSLR